MIVGNEKTIGIIGYRASTMTHEFVDEISKSRDFKIFEPQEFITLERKTDYQYIVASWLDRSERQNVISVLDINKLDLATVIDDTSVLGNNPPVVVEPGVFIFGFCKLCLGSFIGRHSIIGSHSLIGHYTSLGKGCIVRPGTIIVGRSQVGKDCLLNVRSTVSANICDNVELMASSAVYKDINIPGRYVGTPARLIESF